MLWSPPHPWLPNMTLAKSALPQSTQQEGWERLFGGISCLRNEDCGVHEVRNCLPVENQEDLFQGKGRLWERGQETFCVKCPMVNTVGYAVHAVTAQLLNTAIAAWKLPYTTMNWDKYEGARLCLNKNVFMLTYIWISYDFHVLQKDIPFFSHIFQPLKKVKKKRTWLPGYTTESRAKSSIWSIGCLP